jgi:hypothetical protein
MRLSHTTITLLALYGDSDACLINEHVSVSERHKTEIYWISDIDLMVACRIG